LELLVLDKEHSVTAGLNLESKKMPKKGLIKIAGKKLTSTELNKIAIIAPEATVNTIEKFRVTKKETLQLLQIEPNTLRCNNPNCITNHEWTITNFHIIEKDPLCIQCHFCERTVEKQEIQFL
jgi:aspartate carbamoyltransferase regulatory subunit